MDESDIVGQVRSALERTTRGDKMPSDAVKPLINDELRRLAKRYLARERRGRRTNAMLLCQARPPEDVTVEAQGARPLYKHIQPSKAFGETLHDTNFTKAVISECHPTTALVFLEECPKYMSCYPSYCADSTKDAPRVHDTYGGF